MTTQSQEEFIVNNMNIVRNIASKYYTDKIGLDYEDLVSYGVMGLIDARKKFDESRGVKFSTSKDKVATVIELVSSTNPAQILLLIAILTYSVKSSISFVFLALSAKVSRIVTLSFIDIFSLNKF